MDFENNTLAEIVSMKPAAASVFEKYDLDYCCHGKQKLSEACRENNSMLSTIKKELEEIFFYDPNAEAHDYKTMPLPDLIGYIMYRHHRYVREAVPRINFHLEKVTAKHGIRHPELLQIKSAFTSVASELLHHMQKEEMVLWPRISEIADCAGKSGLQWMHDPDFLSSPVHAMEHEHEEAGDLLHQIRKLTNNYTPPKDACMTFKIMYHELGEFERDLHKHVHLENNILFPRAMDLCKKVDEIDLN